MSTTTKQQQPQQQQLLLTQKRKLQQEEQQIPTLSDPGSNSEEDEDDDESNSSSSGNDDSDVMITNKPINDEEEENDMEDDEPTTKTTTRSKYKRNPQTCGNFALDQNEMLDIERYLRNKSDKVKGMVLRHDLDEKIDQYKITLNECKLRCFEKEKEKRFLSGCIINNRRVGTSSDRWVSYKYIILSDKDKKTIINYYHHNKDMARDVDENHTVVGINHHRSFAVLTKHLKKLGCIIPNAKNAFLTLCECSCGREAVVGAAYKRQKTVATTSTPTPSPPLTTQQQQPPVEAVVPVPAPLVAPTSQTVPSIINDYSILIKHQEELKSIVMELFSNIQLELQKQKQVQQELHTQLQLQQQVQQQQQQQHQKYNSITPFSTSSYHHNISSGSAGGAGITQSMLQQTPSPYLKTPSSLLPASTWSSYKYQQSPTNITPVAPSPITSSLRSYSTEESSLSSTILKNNNNNVVKQQQQQEEEEPSEFTPLKFDLNVNTTTTASVKTITPTTPLSSSVVSITPTTPPTPVKTNHIGTINFHSVPIELNESDRDILSKSVSWINDVIVYNAICLFLSKYSSTIKQETISILDTHSLDSTTTMDALPKASITKLKELSERSKYIVIPFNKGKLHWTLFILDTTRNTMTGYDSLGGKYMPSFLHDLFEIDATKHKSILRQNDASSCGIYMLALIEHLIDHIYGNGGTLKDAFQTLDSASFDIAEYRRRLSDMLMTGKLTIDQKIIDRDTKMEEEEYSVKNTNDDIEEKQLQQKSSMMVSTKSSSVSGSSKKSKKEHIVEEDGEIKEYRYGVTELSGDVIKSMKFIDFIDSKHTPLFGNVVIDKESFDNDDIQSMINFLNDKCTNSKFKSAIKHINNRYSSSLNDKMTAITTFVWSTLSQFKSMKSLSEKSCEENFNGNSKLHSLFVSVYRKVLSYHHDTISKYRTHSVVGSLGDWIKDIERVVGTSIEFDYDSICVLGGRYNNKIGKYELLISYPPFDKKLGLLFNPVWVNVRTFGNMKSQFKQLQYKATFLCNFDIESSVNNTSSSSSSSLSSSSSSLSRSKSSSSSSSSRSKSSKK